MREWITLTILILVSLSNGIGAVLEWRKRAERHEAMADNDSGVHARQIAQLETDVKALRERSHQQANQITGIVTTEGLRHDDNEKNHDRFDREIRLLWADRRRRTHGVRNDDDPR